MSWSWLENAVREQPYGELKLNLGSGPIHLPGYENIDRADGKEAYPLEYPDNSVDEVRASHILEHFSHTVTMEVLRDWARVLKPGGVLKLAVPDFEKCILAYQNGDPKAEWYIMGGQTHADDYHKALFNREELVGAMEDVGLTDIQGWNDVGDCSSLAISLNLQGTKTAGMDWLKGRAENRYSQGGEDGILEAVIEKIGEGNRTIVEVGAGDPYQFSNSRKWIEKGWRAILIEKDLAKVDALRKAYADNPNVKVIEAEVSGDGPNRLENLIDFEPQILTIDVDGQDYHVWNGLCKLRPAVVLVEINPLGGDIPAINGGGQAGVEVLTNLAWGKGYVPIGQVNVNLLCVRDDVAPNVGPMPKKAPAKFHLPPNSVQAVMNMPRLAFTDNMFCAMEILPPLGIGIERRNGVFWGQGLTQMFERHIDDGTKYLLCLDYDSVFSREDVMRMLWLMECRPEIDAACPLQMKRESNSPLFTKSMNGEFRKSLEIPWDDLMVADGMEIQTGHFGLTTIRVESLKRLKKPWFIGKPDEEGRWGDGRMDEDIYFWHNWKDSGLSLYLSNRVAIGHIQQVVTWPNKTMKPIHQYCTQYNQNGKPPEAWS